MRSRIDERSLPLLLQPGALLVGFCPVGERRIFVVDLAEGLGHSGIAEFLGQQHIRHHRPEVAGDDVLDVVLEEVPDRGVGDVELPGCQRAAGLLAAAAVCGPVLHAQVIRKPAVGRAQDAVGDLVGASAELGPGQVALRLQDARHSPVHGLVSPLQPPALLGLAGGGRLGFPRALSLLAGL
jgi:hypothetical protein